MPKWIVRGSKYFGEIVYSGKAESDTELSEKVDTAVSWNPDRIVCERMLELDESETSDNETSEDSPEETQTENSKRN